MLERRAASMLRFACYFLAKYPFLIFPALLALPESAAIKREIPEIRDVILTCLD